MENNNSPDSQPPGERSDPIDESALREAVRRLARTSILVVGDAILERTVHGPVSRLSPEAPVPLLTIRHESAIPSGAGGVVRHLAALGAAAAFVAVIGEDAIGAELTTLVGRMRGVEPWLIYDPTRRTVEKTRFIADGGPSGHPLLRTDRDETRPLAEREATRLVHIAGEAMAATSAVVLADHRRGTLAGEVPARLIAAAHALSRPVIVDLRGHDYARFAGADAILTTRRQLSYTLAEPPADDPGFAAAGEALRRQHGFGAVFITSAEAGITLVGPEGWQHFPINAPESPELAGAADAVTAVLAAALAAGVARSNTARLANIAAAIMLRRAPDAVLRGADLAAALSPQAHARRKVLIPAAMAERARRWHRQGWRVGLVVGCFDPLDAADHARIVQARRDCDRLAVLVFDDATVQSRLGPERPTEPQETRAERVAAMSEVARVVLGNEQDAASVLATLRPVLVTGADPVRDAEWLAGAGGHQGQ